MPARRRSLLVLATAVGCSAAAAPAAQAAPRTVIFDLFPSPLVTPASVHLTADSGPFVEKLTWAGWGTATAVGTGTLVDDGGAPGPAPRYAATYTLTNLGPCPRLGPDATSYRGGVISYTRPDGTRKTLDFTSDYDFCARRPTVAAARRTIRAKIRRRGAVTRFSVTCRKGRDATDLECLARYTREGRRRARSFTVFGRMNRGPGLVG